jgi:hypothetical protein
MPEHEEVTQAEWDTAELPLCRRCNVRRRYVTGTGRLSDYCKPCRAQVDHDYHVRKQQQRAEEQAREEERATETLTEEQRAERKRERNRAYYAARRERELAIVAQGTQEVTEQPAEATINQEGNTASPAGLPRVAANMLLMIERVRPDVVDGDMKLDVALRAAGAVIKMSVEKASDE